jgi:hypothetical protein
VILLKLSLLILLALRLLVPPGICLCKLSSPASRLLVSVLGSEPLPQPVEHDDGQHDDGCPAGHLSEGMGVWPTGPVLFDLTSAALLPPLPDVALPGAPPSTGEFSFSAFPRPPLFVSQCALRC